MRDDARESEVPMKKFALLVLLFLTACSNAVPIQTAPPAPNASSPGVSATQVPPPSPRVNAPSANPGLNPTQKTQRDVTYCAPDGVAQKMDLYYPPKSDQPSPVALFVHGGGWSQGDKTQGGVIGFADLASQGFVVATVNYRLAPKYKFPTMIEDVKCAVRFLRANAATLNINPNKIGAWGGSAGGHLVALLGTSDENAGFDGGEYADQSSRVQAVVDMFGPSDLTVLFEGANPRIMQTVFGASGNQDALAAKFSPVTYISKDDPPFLILQGEKDTLVPPGQSQEFYDRLKSAGVPATLVMVKNAGHSFAPSGGAINPSRGELMRMISDFFNRTLK